MLGKSILIGSFVLNNNRTIGGPKSLQGGQERQLFSHAVSRPVTAGTGVNGLINLILYILSKSDLPW